MEAAPTPGFYRNLKMLHKALLSGIAIFIAIAFYIVYQRKEEWADPSLDRTLQLVAVIFTVGSLVTGFRLFNKKIIELRHSGLPVRKKLETYRAACIVWWAMIEGPGLFATAGYFITGNGAFFALALFHLAILAVFMPRRENFKLLLNLSDIEMDELDH